MAATTEAWPRTTQAWIYNSASAGLDKSLQLHTDTAPPPKALLGRESVLVRVSYMSLNPADYKLAELGLLSRALITPPASPGMDYSGTVVSVGSNVTAYKPGQSVFGRIEPTKFGTLAEYIIVKNGEGLAPAPEGFEEKMDQLACVGTCGLTALQSIQPYVPGPGSVKGEKIFINGGSGGTGTFGIQIAKALGLHVTVSCSGANAELCRSLGADDVIDYKTENISEVLKSKGKVFTLVVDNVGYTPAGQQDLYTAADEYLTEDGHFIQVGGGASAQQIKSAVTRSLMPAFLGGGRRNFKMIMTKQSHESLAKIGDWIKKGKVKPVIDEEFAFENAPAAYEKLKTGRARGKIVVKVTK
ncbi:hypothetical protein VP1G_02907 [Cytospora mali]|uniref:Enoyl reductase (ER) domain-containing protein n=1 Tax=Cytospora mali TaxID=578113 RepID=A0A194UV13_CYTMA|nr:hypothetical protein VP1G_02907 [Valsa mali var. pyri (nom. inval.)]